MRIDRLLVVTETVALILTPFSAIAQEKSHLTSEHVTHAVQEIEKLVQKKIQENAVPGVGIAVVFQDLALWPHLTVRGNLAFGLAAKHVPADERNALLVRVRESTRVTLRKLLKYPPETAGVVVAGRRYR